MADKNVPATAGEGNAPAKRRGVAKGTKRQARPLNILLTVDEVGNPKIETASYNSQDILSSFVSLTNQGKKVVLTEWTKPANEAAEG